MSAAAACGRPAAKRSAASTLRVARVEEALAIARAADGAPGALLTLFDRDWRVYDLKPADGLAGPPGEVFARSESAVAVGLVDGPVWIGQAKRPGAREIKLPATLAMAAHLDDLPFAASPSPLRLSGRRRRRLLELRFLQRRLLDRRLRGAVGGGRSRARSPPARARPHRRRRLLVERPASRRHRGRRLARRRVVAQHQRDERSGRAHRARRGRLDGFGLARQRRRRRRVPVARRRRSVDGRERDPQSALQGHGQSLRLGILDLPAAEAGRRRARAPHRRGAAADGDRRGAAARPRRRAAARRARRRRRRDPRARRGARRRRAGPRAPARSQARRARRGRGG